MGWKLVLPYVPWQFLILVISRTNLISLDFKTLLRNSQKDHFQRWNFELYLFRFHSMNWDKVSISEIVQELISQIQQTKNCNEKRLLWQPNGWTWLEFGQVETDFRDSFLELVVVLYKINISSFRWFHLNCLGVNL